MRVTDCRSLIWVLILGSAPATAFARTAKVKAPAPARGAESEASQSSVPQPAVAAPPLMSPAPDSSVPAAQPPASVGPSPLESGPTALKGKWNPTFNRCLRANPAFIAGAQEKCFEPDRQLYLRQRYCRLVHAGNHGWCRIPPTDKFEWSQPCPDLATGHRQRPGDLRAAERRAPCD